MHPLAVDCSNLKDSEIETKIQKILARAKRKKRYRS